MMKCRFVFLGMALFMAFTVKAQIHLFLDEQTITLDEVSVSAWVFPVAGSLDEALSDLNDFAKDRSDVRMKSDGREMMIGEKVSIPAISTNRGDLIGFGFSRDLDNDLALVYRLGYDIALNSAEWPDEMENFRSYARAFMAYHFDQSYARRIDELEKELKGFERDKSQLERKIGRLTKDINKLGKKIGEETETEKINELEVEINEAENELKVLMSEVSPLESQISSIQKKIDQNKAESNTYQGTIGVL